MEDKTQSDLNYGCAMSITPRCERIKDRQVVFDINRGIILPRDTTVYKGLKNNFASASVALLVSGPTATGFFGGGKTVVRGGFGIN